jgi:hypothetical protein
MPACRLLLHHPHPTTTTTHQRYIERPLLLDGYKFDLRLYVCVTSMNPLEAFIYREGFTRLSTEPYRSVCAHTLVALPSPLKAAFERQLLALVCGSRSASGVV